MKYNREILDRFVNGGVAINVETEQEWHAFMRLLESETNCKWKGGQSPTQYESFYQDVKQTAIQIESLGLAHGPKQVVCDKDVVTFKDLVKEDSTAPMICPMCEEGHLVHEVYSTSGKDIHLYICDVCLFNGIESWDITLKDILTGGLQQ